jgi:hypothetical protein
MVPRTQENLFTYTVLRADARKLRFFETNYLHHLITNLNRTEISSGLPIGRLIHIRKKVFEQ